MLHAILHAQRQHAFRAATTVAAALVPLLAAGGVAAATLQPGHRDRAAAPAGTAALASTGTPTAPVTRTAGAAPAAAATRDDDADHDEVITCTTLPVTGQPLCTHGADTKAEMVEHHEALGGEQVDGEKGAAVPSGTGQVGCYGTGSDGPRVVAVYARPDDRPDRYNLIYTSIRRLAADVDYEFEVSAGETGGHRHVRFRTDNGAPGCQVSVLHVTVPAAVGSSFEGTVQAMQRLGLSAPDTKYLVWMDKDTYCGTATLYEDDSAGQTNLNNGRYPMYGVVGHTCWGYAEGHELMHMLGAVQPTAPHATSGDHCNDGADIMCYDDGSQRSAQRNVCSAGHAVRFDCNHDDYFSTRPPAGSYLATHWNTANSAFLMATLRDPARPAKPAPSSPSSGTATSGSGSESPPPPPPSTPAPPASSSNLVSTTLGLVGGLLSGGGK